MLTSDENDENFVLNQELLILQRLTENYEKHEKYVAVYGKKLFECEILAEARHISKTNIIFGSILIGNVIVKKDQDSVIVTRIKSILHLAKAKSSKWEVLTTCCSSETNDSQICCNGFTAGCFSFNFKEYYTPSGYNNILGILVDDSDRPLLPAGEIGRFECSVQARKVHSSWYFFIDKLKHFEKVRSLVMEAKLAENEHFGLVTREEFDSNRNLRLVSSRDFPRDVRIFKRGPHCCEALERKNHDHSNCVSSGIGKESIIGKSVAFKIKHCNGMTSHAQDSAFATPSSSDGCHVDAKHLKIHETQLPVAVHGGFVEIETISEFSGYTDHNGYPLLWSHDVEFIVDFSNVFATQRVGLYLVKAVRFHRENVFAKWRLTRRQPILRTLPTIFHNHLSLFVNWKQQKTNKRRSFSRFGSGAQSCCLPRTDSLDNIHLFDALFRSSSESENMEPIIDVFKDDEDMWKHHSLSAMKIVDDATNLENDSD